MSMQVENDGESNDLDAILKVISDLGRKSAKGEYIYRGEAKHFCKVSSSLYRQFKEIESESFDIESVQEEIIREATKFIPEYATSDGPNSLDLLTQLQHYDGKTNLIDFTADYLIALFFACDGFPDRDGRVILVSKNGPIGRYIKYAPSVNNRVPSQKSVFVQPPQGFVQKYEEIAICSHLKPTCLNYLRNAHNISTETIYNDIFGFIKYRNVHKSAYTEFYRGLTSHNGKKYDKAIAHYSESINLNSQSPSPYINRGICYIDTGYIDLAITDFNSALNINSRSADAYISRGVAFRKRCDFDLAIRDYNKALELKPGYADALYNRGELWLILSKWDQAVSDLTAARDNGMDIKARFRKDHGSATKFNQKYGVDIPEHLAKLLGG